jgi:hypothetical protein
MPELDALMITGVTSADSKWTRETFAFVSGMHFESEPNAGKEDGVAVTIPTRVVPERFETEASSCARRSFA